MKLLKNITIGGLVQPTSYFDDITVRQVAESYSIYKGENRIAFFLISDLAKTNGYDFIHSSNHNLFNDLIAAVDELLIRFRIHTHSVYKFIAYWVEKICLNQAHNLTLTDVLVSFAESISPKAYFPPIFDRGLEMVRAIKLHSLPYDVFGFSAYHGHTFIGRYFGSICHKNYDFDPINANTKNVIFDLIKAVAENYIELGNADDEANIHSLYIAYLMFLAYGYNGSLSFGKFLIDGTYDEICNKYNDSLEHA